MADVGGAEAVWEPFAVWTQQWGLLRPLSTAFQTVSVQMQTKGNAYVFVQDVEIVRLIFFIVSIVLDSLSK